MNKIAYIIPGLGEKTTLLRYKKLAKALEAQGYQVKALSPNWYKPLSDLVFPVEKEVIVIGFSMGAVLAYLIARIYPYQKMILASLSPIDTFTFEEYRDELLPFMRKDEAEVLARDVKSIHIDLKTITTPYVTLRGELENDISAQVIVPETGHEMTDNYVSCIIKLV